MIPRALIEELQCCLLYRHGLIKPRVERPAAPIPLARPAPIVHPAVCVRFVAASRRRGAALPAPCRFEDPLARTRSEGRFFEGAAKNTSTRVSTLHA